MGLASFQVAGGITRWHPVWSVVLGAYLLTVWDLVLDDEEADDFGDCSQQNRQRRQRGHHGVGPGCFAEPLPAHVLTRARCLPVPALVLEVGPATPVAPQAPAT